LVKLVEAALTVLHCYADADERVIRVGILDVEDLVRLEFVNIAVDREFIVADPFQTSSMILPA
jgi:hypothetical protein